MSRIALPILALGLGLALALANPLRADEGLDEGLLWIHAEANEGHASGGHSALRVGERVYHFQTVSGRSLLSRWSWRRFRHLYGDLENRTLHTINQPLETRALERIESSLDRGLRRVRVELARENDLSFQRALLGAWAGLAEDTVPLRGLAPFEAGGRTRSDRLTVAIEDAHGERFLPERIARQERLLAEWRLSVRDDASEATRYREAMELLHAFRILARGTPVVPTRQLAASSSRLSSGECGQLERIAGSLERTIVRLAASTRPDRGHALLLATARHRTLERSLSEGRLLTLDPFPAQAGEVAPPRRAARRRVFERMAAALVRERAALQSRLLRKGQLRELEWLGLERISAALVELRRGLDRGAAIRLLPERGLPTHLGRAPAPRPPVIGAAAARHLHAAAREAEQRQRASLDRRYDYHLLGRNCATELVRAVQASFDTPRAAASALGAQLDPGLGLRFLPAASLAAIEAHYRPAHRGEIAPYRARALQRMRAQEHPLWVSLREINTLSSTVYVGSPADSHFLFFTTGSPVLRPLLGSANLAFGFAHSAVGLASWPWDGGERLDRGLRGILWSLPELAFLNLRKGTFEYAPDR